jgi:hypothetical protein
MIVDITAVPNPGYIARSHSSSSEDSDGELVDEMAHLTTN